MYQCTHTPQARQAHPPEGRYTTNVGKVQYHFDMDTLAFGEEYWYTPLREMAGTPSSRRTTATAGCAVSRHILGQAEPETAEQMAGSHGRSKIGRNSEYRPDRKYRPPVHPSGWCCAGPSTRALLLPAIPTAASHHCVPFCSVIAPASLACAQITLQF